MDDDVREIQAIDATMVAAVGAKAATLGELSRLTGIRVPPGFCVTTDAYRRVVAADDEVAARVARLAGLDAGDRRATRAAGESLRRRIEAIALPDELADAVREHLGRLGEGVACAVRSSATAEDLPTASFAGQHDSYLNVVGLAAVLDHVRRCWASLFTDRAVAYRSGNGLSHDTVEMAVVVQRLVVPDVSGVLFTADPVTGNRRTTTVEAGFGLGEALVDGVVEADAHEVRDGVVVARRLGAKQVATVILPGGGTTEQPVDPSRRARAALTDGQVVELAAAGRRVEAHLGAPQDVEWCLDGDGFHLVQSRPITTLFPLPASAADGEPHVYVSVGHQQMMTDAMKPFGLSLWQLLARPVMHEAAGRLFVDVAPMLASASGRAALRTLATSDPLIGDALQVVVDRGDLVPPLPDEPPAGRPPARPPTAGAPMAAGPGGAASVAVETDAALVAELVERNEASVAALAHDLEQVAGVDVFGRIRADVEARKDAMFDPRSLQAVMAGMDAAVWLNDRLATWLGERGAGDVLTRSAPGNVSSEMGLALLEVADAVRPHPEVLAVLEEADDDAFLDRLDRVDGGDAARLAIEAFLHRYGMRCVGEIDVTRPRWVERPSALLPAILANVRSFEPGEGQRRFERGHREAATKARDVLARLRALPDGAAKAAETAAMIERVRTFAGYREHPKYVIVGRTWQYKQAVLVEVERLVRAGVLREVDDAWFLRFEELEEVVRTGAADLALVDRRRAAFRADEARTPPRVLTSEGEAIRGAYRRADVPDGALVGLGVSAGTVEGRARVVRDLADATFEPGDILVTPFTDPSWSPAFVSIAGLVTEVGGLMTHGAVVAREYGLPAVVGVEQATERIAEGRRIRVHGADGYVELLA